MALAAASLTLGWPVLSTFVQTGRVPRLPTAIAASGAMILAFTHFSAGLLRDTVTLRRREMKRQHYLGLPGPTCRARRAANAPAGRGRCVISSWSVVAAARSKPCC